MDVKKYIDEEVKFDNLSRKETYWAKKRFKDYISQYSIEKLGELQLLEELCYRKALQTRDKQRLAQIEKTGETKKGFIPDKILKRMEDNDKMIIDIMDKLGFFEKDEKKSVWERILILGEKFKIWRNENQASRELVCVAKDTEVLYSDFTSKPIQEVKAGDEILGIQKTKNSGLLVKKQKVLKTFDNGKKEVLRLRTDRNRELICTPDHRIFAHYKAKNSISTTQAFTKAEDSILRYLKGFNYIRNLHKYYEGVLLGFIESDGWKIKPKNKNNPSWNFTVRYSISQSKQGESKALDWILKYLRIKHYKKFRKRGWGNGAYRYDISTEHSDYITQIKEKLFKDDDIALGFLAGFILGDGYLDKNGNCHISQKNKIDLLLEVFNYLHLWYSVSKNVSGSKCHMYCLKRQIPLLIPDSRKSKTFLNKIFSNGSHKVKERVVSIELLKESHRVYDLQTELKNYIANGIIVHNCPFCSKTILLNIRADKYDAHKHPFFQDKYLGNKHLWECYKAGKLEKMDVAKILHGWDSDTVKSGDYVDWLEKKIFKDNEQRKES